MPLLRSLPLVLLLLCADAPQVLAATTALTSPAEFGPSVTLDFDEQSHGTAANTLYLAQGVEFRNDDMTTVPIYDWAALSRTTTSSPNVISTVSGLNGSTFSPWLDLIFATPVLEVGAFFGNDQGVLPVVVQLSVFDESDLLLGTTTVQANLNTSVDQFIGLRSDDPIGRARFEYIVVGDLSVTLDDVIFTPEPGTGALLLMGVLALAASRRR